MKNIEIVTVSCLEDNYAYLVHDVVSGRTAVVDAPDARPIMKRLEARGWQPDVLWITHHHSDHIDGVEKLRQAYPQLRVIGAEYDEDRLPRLDMTVTDQQTVWLGENIVEIIDVSGHTVGHIAFYIPAADAVFTADSLFVLGCGRVFEGTYRQMYESLQKLAALPPETVVYCGHEYSQSNAKFALHVDPGNAVLKRYAQEIADKRAANQPTVPTTIAKELATNPFLRTDVPAIIKASKLHKSANPVEVFAEIRRMKDNF